MYLVLDTPCDVVTTFKCQAVTKSLVGQVTLFPTYTSLVLIYSSLLEGRSIQVSAGVVVASSTVVASTTAALQLQHSRGKKYGYSLHSCSTALTSSTVAVHAELRQAVQASRIK